MFSPPTFPIRLADLPGRIEHLGFRAGETLRFADGVEVATLPLRHPGGSTGYRFDHRGRAICYVSDIEHGEPCLAAGRPRGLRAGRRPRRLRRHVHRGRVPALPGLGPLHMGQGVELARAAWVGALAVFHLHPAHDDAALARIEADLRAAMPSAFLAREGQGFAFAPVG